MLCTFLTASSTANLPVSILIRALLTPTIRWSTSSTTAALLSSTGHAIFLLCCPNPSASTRTSSYVFPHLLFSKVPSPGCFGQILAGTQRRFLIRRVEDSCISLTHANLHKHFPPQLSFLYLTSLESTLFGRLPFDPHLLSAFPLQLAFDPSVRRSTVYFTDSSRSHCSN